MIIIIIIILWCNFLFTNVYIIVNAIEGNIDIMIGIGIVAFKVESFPSLLPNLFFFFFLDV